MSTTASPAVDADGKISCRLCGAAVHAIQTHLRDDHKDLGMTIEGYKAQYPDAPVFSPRAEALLRDKMEQKAREEAAATGAAGIVNTDFTTELFYKVFGLTDCEATRGASGRPLKISVIQPGAESVTMVPEQDGNYVYNLDILKQLLMALEMKIPAYLWGHAGTGKTTIYEQIAAKTNRPMFRVQHTANMEEEHVVGGWRLRDGRTQFELGPLPLAMKFGWLYLADEYDFGRPEVLSLYQAVLEGKPLVIKEADPENRVIKPHPNFRIVATGNTNGQGDETGLYSGTVMQNAANYERFGVVLQMPYMEKKLEARMIAQQCGIPATDADKLVDFANRVRKEFEAGQLANPISPRSLIYAGKLGVAKKNFRTGLELAFLNRLTAADREAADQLAQRVFS